MPSPQIHAPALPNGASSTNPHPQSISESNGVAGAAQKPVANGNSQAEEHRSQSPVNTIEENKQKARAIMAASGAPNPSTADITSTEPSDSPSANGVHTNGASQTRKRSRDGTLIPQPSRSSSRGVPERTKEDYNKIMLEQYLTREMSRTAALLTNSWGAKMLQYDMGEQAKAYGQLQSLRAHQPGRIFGQGWSGYGNSIQDSGGRGPRIILPAHRKRIGGRKSKELKIGRKDRATQAEQIDELVPIRLDIEWDKVRLRDTFTWNIHDRVVPPELFAEQLVEDFKLPLPQCESLVQQIYTSIHEQITDFHPHVYIDEGPLDPHLPYTAYKNDDMRIVIKLNITIGQHTLVDQFEWEINNHLNSPEEFAQQMTRDLSLSGEFTTAIAHSIREQSQLFTRSLYVTGHPFDGRPIEDHELQSAFCQSPMPSSFRPYQAAKEFTPYLYELNETELEKTELSLSREERRQKRSVNRRGGPALPDLKDRRRTNRTLLVSTVLPGAVESMEDSRLFKRTVVSTKGRRGGMARDGLDDSEESESEDSPPGSPAIPAHLLAGTSRTRGMRGAASAAQQAMRSNIGRSATPESATAHHHETRTSGRRIIHEDASSTEPQTSLIVKLRLPRQKFQQLLRDQRARGKDASHTPGPRPTSRNSSTSAPPGSMGPPSTTPRMNRQSLPDQPNGASGLAAQETPPSARQTSNSLATPSNPPTSRHGATSMLGRVDATGTPGKDHPVPDPPVYLTVALNNLQAKYPDDLFEGTMRCTAVSTDTDEPFTLRPDATPPPNTKYCYYPRIKCKDCPGKLYTPDVTLGVNNFEVHLKNRHHRDRVAKRTATANAAVAAAAAAAAAR